jgi:putative copper resistance protein D
LGDPLGYVRALHFAATIIAAGAVIFEVMVAAPAFAAAAGMLHPDITRLRSRWSWLVWASLAMAAVSGAIWLVLLASDIYAAPIAEGWRDGGLWTVARETRFGQVSLARLGAAALLAPLLPILRRSADRGLWSAGAVALAIAVLIGPAWTGHAGATPGTAGEFPLAADALHLLAAGAWLGGLPPLAMLLNAAWRGKEPRWATVTAIAVQRFSLLGVISVSALLASGITNSWYEVGTLNNLFATSYGQLVLIKIGLFAAMIALATINRFYLTPRLATRRHRSPPVPYQPGRKRIGLRRSRSGRLSRRHGAGKPHAPQCGDSRRRRFRSHPFQRRHGRRHHYAGQCRHGARHHSAME